MSKQYKQFGEYLEHVRRFGDRDAVATKPFLRLQKLTFEELYLEACKTAQYLTSLDIHEGDRIMIVAPNSPQWVTLFLGAQRAGIIVIPVDVASSRTTVENYMKQTKPKVVFRGKRVLNELDGYAQTQILEDLPQLIKDQPTRPPRVKLTGSMPSVIVFTSGTTADPKGVMLTQAHILSNIAGVHQALHIDSAWRFLSILPLSHTYELTVGCLTILSGGARIYYLPQVTPTAITKGLKEYQITSLFAVPQIASLFLRKIEQTAEAHGKLRVFHGALRVAHMLPFPCRRYLFGSVHKALGGHLQFMAIGGAPLSKELAETWENMGVKMVQGYGLTETSPILTMNTLKERNLGFQGHVIMNGTQLRITKEGEIEAKGPGVFREYWHNKAASKAAFTKDGWFKTGDLGTLTNGLLSIKGRTRFVIVLPSGLKVFPEDVEVVATEEVHLKDVCVVATKHAGNEEVHLVTTSKATNTQIERAIQMTNERLESFQHINHWSRWPEADFPRTRLLKIDRRKVEQWANQTTTDVSSRRSTDVRAVDPLVSIIRLVLNKPHLKVPDEAVLSDLGLDSLRRLALVSAIEERIGVSVDEVAITQMTTVKTLRASIEHGSAVQKDIHFPNWQYNPVVRAIGNSLRDTLIRGIVGIWVRVHVEGQEHLASLQAPAILIFNHVDNLDAPVIYRAMPRNIRNHLAIAAADDVMKPHKMLTLAGRLFFGAFNLARSEPYMPSLEYAGQLLDRRWYMTVAPEGKISVDGALQPFKSGIGLLTVEGQVPVVPVKTIGLRTMPLHSTWPKRRSKVTVRIGEPIRFVPGTDYDTAARKLHDAMRRL